MELWKEISETNGNYFVSTYGRVKSIGRIIGMGKRGQRYRPELILKPSMSNKGYPRVRVWVETLTPIHRLVAIAFIPNTQNKPEVNHKDGVKANNQVDNLEWSTRSENERHARATGLKRLLKGGNHPQSLLSDAQRQEIGILYNSGMTLTQIGKLKGFHSDYIGKVITKLGITRRPRVITFCGERKKAYNREYQREWQRNRKSRIN